MNGLNVLTQIDIETATEWLATLAMWRERKLRSQGRSIPVSIGEAVIDLMQRRNGPSTRAGILMGRFDERSRACKQGRGKVARVYQESFDPQTMGATQDNSVVQTILASMTDSELVLAQCIMSGMTGREIARKLDVSEMTISRRLAAIREKFSE